MVPQRQLIRVATFAAGLALATYWVALAVGVQSPLVTHWVYLGLHVTFVVPVIARAVLRREDRLAWGALAAGLASWTFGSIWQVARDLAGAAEPPFPSVSDFFWVGAYPFGIASAALLARPWLKRAPKTVALEALAVGL